MINKAIDRQANAHLATEKRDFWTPLIGVCTVILVLLTGLGTYFGYLAIAGSGSIYKGPGTPSKKEIENPALAQMVNSVSYSYYGIFKVSLYSCILHESEITCYLTQQKLNGGYGSYNIQDLYNANTTSLFDGAQVPHVFKKATWINGLDQPVPSINIDVNQPTWFVLTFDAAPDGGGPGDTKSAKIHFLMSR